MEGARVPAPTGARPFLPRLPLPRRDTRLRLAFDLLFGAVVPVVLLHLELRWLPVLEDIAVEGVLFFRPYEPVAALSSIALLLAWYPLRGRESWMQALAAGPLLLGGAFAGGLALVLSPLSFMGMMLHGIGALGFLPFVTAAVFLDAGGRAFAAARRALPAGPVIALALLSALVFGGGCLGAGRIVRVLEVRQTGVVAGSRPGSPAAAEIRLRVLYALPGVRLRDLQFEGRRPLPDGTLADPAAARAWERITGRPIPPPFGWNDD